MGIRDARGDIGVYPVCGKASASPALARHQQLHRGRSWPGCPVIAPLPRRGSSRAVAVISSMCSVSDEL